MKILTLILSLIALSLNAGNLHKLRFSRTDGSEWECLTVVPSPESPALLISVGPVGSHTNYYAQSYYSIRPISGSLWMFRNEVNEGQVLWPAYPYLYSFVPWFGFCIDHAGQGWFCGTLDGDNQGLLFKVDISSGTLTYVDYLDLNGPDDIFFVNGCTMIEFP